ncbi:10291_t:CDS:2, partial [Cetraspora pellucida]
STDNDEISLYLDARYVSASEASWRLFHYLHLPGQHRVTFRDNEVIQNVIERANSEKTTLTAWFHANNSYPEARTLTYGNFPTHWVFEKKTNKWKPRQRGNVIGRMYFVHPSADEHYYTFKEACSALSLLQNDDKWDFCLLEAAQIQSGAQLRTLFATILLFCNPVYPENLWEKHFSALTDDLPLLHLQSILNKHGRCLTDFPKMPLPTILPNSEHHNNLITEELNYNIADLTQIVENGLADFADWLLKLGEGRIPTITPEEPTIRLPNDIVLSTPDLNNLDSESWVLTITPRNLIDIYIAFNLLKIQPT